MILNQRLGLQPSYWSDIPSGITSYVTELRSQITRSTILTSHPISTVSYRDGRYYLTHASGATIDVDHLIITTNAQQAYHMIKNIDHAHARAQALRAIDYIYTTIAVHEDQKFMPHKKDEWSVANVWYNGAQSTLTIYKKERSSFPLFRSWVIPGFPYPCHIHAIKTYYHAIPNHTYFQTQNILNQHAGDYNLWFAGIYTHDIDSHESALFSAVKIAKMLAPHAQRLSLLCN